jgi:hypothetical protein
MGKIRVGDVAFAPLPGGGFGACQVSGVLPDTVTLHALDWHGPQPPRLDDLRGAGPAIVTRHRIRPEVARTSVARKHSPMPPDFTWIGNLPVPAGVPDTIDTWSGWRTPLLATVFEREWAGLPEEVRAAYRMARGADPVTVDLGAGPTTVMTGLGELDLNAWPADRPMDRTLLGLLPRCGQMAWTGPDRGLVAALRQHPLVTTLTWSDAPETVDLTGTGVRHLEINGKDLREVRLRPGTQSLRIDGTDTARTVHADDDGRWLHLHIDATAPGCLPPAGLGAARSVSLTGPGVLSAATVAGFTEAHTLSLFWDSPPGTLADQAALAGLTGLRLLEMTDAYDLDVTALPGPPLQHLDIEGLRGSTARALRTHFRGSGVTLTLSGAKSDAWLATHLSNPLRDWSDDDPAAGDAACRAYATALQALDRIARPAGPPALVATTPSTSPTASATPAASGKSATPDHPAPSASPDRTAKPTAPGNPAAPDRTATPGTPATSGSTAAPDNPAMPATLGDRAIRAAPRGLAAPISSSTTPDSPAASTPPNVLAAEPILRELVERLNAIDDKFDIIDTVRREEAGDAFMDLAARAGVPFALADEWFDAWRDF